MTDLSSRVVRRVKGTKIALRVAKRVLAKGLPMGQTFQNEKIRIHRYADHLRITDLTNAGKRGKKVNEMYVALTYNYKGDPQGWFDQQTEYMISNYSRGAKPYDSCVGFLKDLQRDFPDAIRMSESDLRGIDVEPFGEVFDFKIPLDNGGSISVKSSPLDFAVKSTARLKGPSGNEFNQDTLFSPVKKKDAVAFYGWMKDNSAKLKSLKSMNDLRDIWSKQGISYDYH